MATTELQLNEFLPYLMVHFAGRLSSALAKRYQREFGLTVAEWRVLANVNELGQLRSKDVAERTSMDKVKVSRAVQSLCDKGWIKKTDDAKDSRAYYLSLTAAGNKIMAKMIPAILHWQDDLLRGWSKKDFKKLIEAIHQLDERLDHIT